MVKQGTIIKINFNPQAGHEQAGYRPAVVISNNIFNEKTRLSIVCPITNTNNHFPLHIPLDERTKTTGVILCEHIKALDLEISRGREFTRRSIKRSYRYCLFRNRTDIKRSYIL